MIVRFLFNFVQSLKVIGTFLQNLTFGDLSRSNVKKGEPTGFSFCQKIIVYTLSKPNQQKTDRGYVCRVKCYSGTVCATPWCSMMSRLCCSGLILTLYIVFICQIITKKTFFESRFMFYTPTTSSIHRLIARNGGHFGC